METQYVDVVDQTPTILINILSKNPPFRRIQCSTKKINTLKDGQDLIGSMLEKCPTAVITSLRIVQSNDPCSPSSKCRTDNPMFKHVPVNEELSVVRFLQHTTPEGLLELRDKLSPNEFYEIAGCVSRNGGYARTRETEVTTRETLFGSEESIARWNKKRASYMKELEEKRRVEEDEKKKEEVRAAVEGGKKEEEVKEEVKKSDDDDEDKDDILDLSDDDFVVITQEDICP